MELVRNLIVLLAAITQTATGAAVAATLCMSDDELDTLLYATHSRSLGVGIGVCSRKFPALQEDGMKIAQAFAAKHRHEMQSYPTSYKEAFDRAFGQNARSREEEFILENSDRLTYEGYNIAQCKKHLSALEAMSHLRNVGSLLQGLKGMAWEEWRRSIPRCQ